MHIQVLMYKQDDPKKCTAAKLVKFGLARNVKNTSSKTLVLNPFADSILLQKDKKKIKSISAIDCTWTLANQIFLKNFSGLQRKLPPVFAGNPVNYSKINKLTTVEAISAALYILEERKQAMDLLAKFKWGHTFFELNKNLLNEYSNLQSEDELQPLLREYGLPF